MRGPAAPPAVVLELDGLEALLAELQRRRYRTLGPTVRDGTLTVGPLRTIADLPVGWHDEQAPGSYRLARGDDHAHFGWAVGPSSPRSVLFPAQETVWRARQEAGAVRFLDPPEPDPPTALFGIRPCDLAAVAVLDRVLSGGAVADARYAARRRHAFLVVAECGAPSASCFCTSLGTGPAAHEPADLVLCELDPGQPARHRFLVRPGSDHGAAVLAAVPHRPATDDDRSRRATVLADAERRIHRRLDTGGLPDLLARNLAHPRWAEVARRCLSCGNCTMVCPTCFCSDLDDVTDLAGTVERRRRWASCFELGHSYLHGGPVRTSLASRYRQWATHKLSTWHDQFGTSGCVGCGRCITWCPVGIDLTEEVAAVRAADGAVDAPDGRSEAIS